MVVKELTKGVPARVARSRAGKKWVWSGLGVIFIGKPMRVATSALRARFRRAALRAPFQQFRPGLGLLRGERAHIAAMLRKGIHCNSAPFPRSTALA